MVEVVYLPRRAAEEAKRRGIDIGDLILKVLAQELKLDPEGSFRSPSRVSVEVF